ncbi:MAG TPA: hypothetical protein VIH37_10525, partial [Candidatus Limnocylindrales bacterium]
PWLRQPAAWAERTVEAQLADTDSVLNLYRAALRIRRRELVGADEALTWLPSTEGVLAFVRGPRFACVTNLSSAAVELPVCGELLLASADLDDGRLPADATAWIQPDPSARQGAGPSTRETA